MKSWRYALVLFAVLGGACMGQTVEVGVTDGGGGGSCNRPSATAPGLYNVQMCSSPSCDNYAGASACPCKGATLPDACGFDAIHDDGHVFTAQCDPATGECTCTYDNQSPCTCHAMPHALCVLDGPLNCCF